jgi:hypothetical protein
MDILLTEGTDQEYYDLALEIITISHTLAYNHRLLYFAPPKGCNLAWSEFLARMMDSLRGCEKKNRLEYWSPRCSLIERCHCEDCRTNMVWCSTGLTLATRTENI